ncbi:MAG: hypothetical protein J0H47_16365 [Gammaproteobacteria bacterium]|nr:hypothetical protein [Gammaproteobacteria bacterium]
MKIPASPHLAYKEKGWVSWGEWLGTGIIAPQNRKFRSYKQARQFARSLRLNGVSDWQMFCKSGNRPDDIPSRPNSTYLGQGWISWADWLGTKNVAPQNRVFRDFKKARAFARALKLNAQSDWKEYCKSGSRPTDIPAAPHKVYRNLGWISWGDWLGTSKIATQLIKFKSFREARKLVRSLNLKSINEWKQFCIQQKPKDIPSTPDRTYRNSGWISYKDWLGISN